MHFDPSLPDVRHSPFREPAIVQRSLHNAGGGHKPVAPVTAGGFVHLGRMDSQPDKGPSPRARSFPLFPVAQPHTPPQPLVQFRHFAIGLTDTEVVQPTHHVAPELQQQCPHGHAATATGDFLYSFSEPFERFLRPYDSSPAYLEPEEGAVG